MKVKICFNDEIHRLSKVPETFKAFTVLIANTFQAQLPESWTLNYLDSNGDSISIGDEKEFEKFKTQDSQSTLKVTKIFIVPADKVLAVVDEKINKDNGDYEVIQKEEVKAEKLPELKVEEIRKESESQEAEENKDDRSIPECVSDLRQSIHEDLVNSALNGKLSNKILIDVSELEKIVQRIFESKIIEITESIKMQLSVSQKESFYVRQPEEKEEENNSEILREKVEAETQAKIKEEEEKVAENYFNSLVEKAKKLLKCFPKEDFDMLCAYVNEAPEDMTLEELVENFKH